MIEKEIDAKGKNVGRSRSSLASNGMPTFDRLMNPLLDALSALGGSGSTDEIYEKVIELQDVDEGLASVPHNPDKSNLTEIGYRLACARTYLKKYGFLENSARGVWALTKLAKENKHVIPKDVIRKVRLEDKKTSKNKAEIIGDSESPLPDQGGLEGDEWEQELHYVLTKEMSSHAFERLTQRILRESGFIQVEVTGRTGDGGLDGKGIARIHGFMSFHVIFQCKKYQGSVTAGDIRDFRGAMVGRADKGLFMTTGTFTPSAIKEATRDGAPPIDLVDGKSLAQKLKELKLGVKTEMIEKVTVDKEWLKGL